MFQINPANSSNSIGNIVLTIAIVVLAYATIGQLPLMIAVQSHSDVLEGISGPILLTYSKVLGKNLLLFYLLVPFLAAFIALLLCVKFIHKQHIRSLFTSRKRFDFKRFFHSFCVWGLVLGVYFILTIFNSNTLTFQFPDLSFITLFLIALLLIPIQTTFEEVFFRTYLFAVFKTKIKKSWIVVVVTGLIFGLLHGSNPEVQLIGYSVLAYYIVTGFFLGILRFFDEGLELSMGYHAVNNLFAAIVVSNEWQAFQTDALFLDHAKPSFGWDAILTICIAQPVLLIYFAKKYNWFNWKEKISQ